MKEKNGAEWICDVLEKLAQNTMKDHEIWRAIYTKEDKIAKEIIEHFMEEAGLSVRRDSVGNIYGRKQGKTDQVVLLGSHIDTVKNGGKYDGALGVVTAIAVLKKLNEEGATFEKTIEVVAMSEEEGSRFGSAYLGSRAITGKLSQEDLKEEDVCGITVFDAMKAAGYHPEELEKARRTDLDTYVELHIEQGPVLEQEKKQIGVVENIAGIKTYDITIEGRQNHAGTTPMHLRKDPMPVVCKLMLDMTEQAKKISKTATITFGRIEAYPGMSNVVAQKVEFLVDMRDGRHESMVKIDEQLLSYLEQLKKLGFSVDLKTQCDTVPVVLDPSCIRMVEEAAIAAGMSYLHMNSGAGHDAQAFADIAPTCMLFIPSKNGISHNPLEYSGPEDIEAGYRTLLRLVGMLAKPESV